MSYSKTGFCISFYTGFSFSFVSLKNRTSSSFSSSGGLTTLNSSKDEGLGFY